MASLSHSESRRLYSWWWDSHIPKNSKWLQENLTDMDAKVKAMIKLIEEDADSFARRAEMYYKKRPELMKLVEEFYRAYRALAERYDHATVELRHAHRTMAEAFPNQVPITWTDDSPSGSLDLGAEPHTPETLHPNHAVFDPEDLHKDTLGLSSTNLHALKRNVGNSEKSSSEMGGRGLKQLNDICVSGEGRMKKGQKFNEAEESQTNIEDQLSQISSENQSLKQQVLFESEHAVKAENEVQSLKKTLAEIQAEKETVFLQYQQSLEKLSNLEAELCHAQNDIGGLGELTSKADIEIKILKEALSQLEAERDTALVQYNKCLGRICSLENLLSLAQEKVKGQNERTTQAESEAQHLKQKLSRLVAEKEAGLLQYEKCREKISILEGQISLAEENAALLREQLKRAESEVKALKEALVKLNEENEVVVLHYKQCLETIAKLESEMSKAQVDTERLKSEVLTGAAKLKSTEEQCDQLERSNKFLRLEADDLLQKISRTDRELSQKNDELKKLQILMQDEHSKFLQVEATLQALQKVHGQSQEDQRALAIELNDGLQMLKKMETCKQDMEEEVQRVKEENRSVTELNITCTVSLKNMQEEIFSLKEIKERLEQEVKVKEEQSNSLQQDIFHLNAEIKDLSKKYQAMTKQVESVGLNPECLESSVKDLQDENSRLNEICKREKDERSVLYEKMKDMGQLSTDNAILHSSLSILNGELEGLREKVKKLQESCHFLQGEKSSLVAEKSALLSQLQIVTENMQKLLEKNTLLENSLSGANTELEQLRSKSKNMEELCQLLNNEKSSLLNERSNLVSQLENVTQRLGSLENRFTRLEERYSDLEKEKELTLYQVEELRGSLLVEKDERSNFMQSTETQLEGLQSSFHFLQEERKLGKKEFEEELDKAVNAHVEIFILKKFIEDLEEKNLSLFIECQKYVEASKFSDKLISELESENLEQQVEAELFVDEIKKLRLGIHQVFMAVQTDLNGQHTKKLDNEQISVHCILDSIDTLKGSLLRAEDEEQQLLVENSVLFTLLRQFRAEGKQIESEKEILEKGFENLKGQHYMLQREKHNLLETNGELKSELSKKEAQEQALKVELETMCDKLTNLQIEYLVLQEQNFKVLDDNKSLLHKICDLKEKNNYLEKENNVIIHEVVELASFSLVLESFMSGKASELKQLSEERSTLDLVNTDLKEEIGILREELAANKAKTVRMNNSIEMLNEEVHEVKNVNGQLSLQVLLANDFMKQKTAELSEAEQKITATDDLNLELTRTVEELNMESEELKISREILAEKIYELSETSICQTKRIESLDEANQNLETKVGVLCKEIEERSTKEENLCSELQGKSSEFELFEAEATTFYFDLQTSAVREVLLENKVHELVGVCEILEDENTAKSLQIEQIKAQVISLESQIGGLEAQLSDYVPVIDSLKENVASLEHNALFKREILAAGRQVKGAEMAVHLHEIGFQELKEDKSTAIPKGVMDLQKMLATIKAIEMAMVEEMDKLAIEGLEKAVEEEVERLATEEFVTMDMKAEAELQHTESLTSKVTSPQEEDIANAAPEFYNDLGANHNLQKTKPENGILMKDIPLDHVSDQSFHGRSRRKTGGADDQMLRLWETVDPDYSQEEMANETQNHVSVTKENENPKSPSHDRGKKTKENENPKSPSHDRGKKKNQDSSEVQAERELGIDMLEVSYNIFPNKEGSRGMFLERLASDAQKLTSLQSAVQKLKKKLEMNKRRKKANDDEFETVKQQLLEVEEAVVQLAGINGQLTKDIEECPPSLEGKTSPTSTEDENIRTSKATEQAQKGFEKIGRLQLEVQNIQYILLKLQDDNKNKGKSKVSESKTGVLLRDFIHNDNISSPKRKKTRFCGCRRPSTNED